MPSSTPGPNLNNFFFSKKSFYPVGLSTIVTGFLYGVEYLMEKQNPCPCDPKLNARYTYISFLIPAFAMFLLSLLVSSDAREMITRRACSSAAANRSCWEMAHFCFFTILKVLVPSILWAAILFHDGDYYACAYLNETVHGQDCNETCASKSLPHERRQLCVLSQVIGGTLLVLTLLVLVVLHFLPGCLCPQNTQEGKTGDMHMQSPPEIAETSKRLMSPSQSEVRDSSEH